MANVDDVESYTIANIIVAIVKMRPLLDMRV